MGAGELSEQLRLLSDSDRALVQGALEQDPELAEDLRPVLAGDYGDETKRLFLGCFVDRLRTCGRARDALLPALADAMRSVDPSAEADR